jgi:hypothetical protein
VLYLGAGAAVNVFLLPRGDDYAKFADGSYIAFVRLMALGRPRSATLRGTTPVDFVASNVPGFPFPVYLAGARSRWLLPFGPTIGAAINATLLSYDGTCCIGFTFDTSAVPYSDTLVRCVGQGFEELLALGGEHDHVVLPLHDGSYPGSGPMPAGKTRR